MDLQKLFDEHREKSKNSCDKTCLCWDVEGLLTLVRDSREQQNRLENLLHEHRRKSKISCDETCFCWDVDNMFAFIEQTRETVNPFSRASVKRAVWRSIYKPSREPSTVERVIALAVFLLVVAVCILSNL